MSRHYHENTHVSCNRPFLGMETASRMVSTSRNKDEARLFSDNLCRIQHTRRAYDTMTVFMRSQVNTIRETIRSEATNEDTKPGNDLFSLLIHASEDAGGKKGLSDDELVSRPLALLFCRGLARHYGRYVDDGVSFFLRLATYSRSYMLATVGILFWSI